MLFRTASSTIGHREHASDKVEILGDAQIFVKTESLGHVADFELDRFALCDHVMPEAGAAPLVGTKQPAQHPDECGFAAAVRAEKPVDFASADLEFDVVDDRSFAEPLGHPTHIDRQIG